MTFSFNPMNLEALLSGSHVVFKNRKHPLLSEQELEVKYENERKLQEGINLLRKIRTHALEEQDAVIRQHVLKDAHYLSEQMAEVIITQASSVVPNKIESSFLETLSAIKNKYINQEAESGYSLPPQFSITNLFRAADDMLIRIEEMAESIYTPNHKLTREELRYVLNEFLRGTNDLSINAIDRFFEKDSRVGGILSGGSVYAEMAKRIVDVYANPALKLYSFVIAVDKQNRKAVFETSEPDNDAQTVCIMDDMINTGSTVLPALFAAGEYFPNATIYSGKGTDSAGGFEMRRTHKHMNYLANIFQDFADLSENGQKNEAFAIFQQAEEYAQKNKVQLPRGWYLRKERLNIC